MTMKTIILKGVIFYEKNAYSNSFQLVLRNTVPNYICIVAKTEISFCGSEGGAILEGEIHYEEWVVAWPTVSLWAFPTPVFTP